MAQTKSPYSRATRYFRIWQLSHLGWYSHDIAEDVGMTEQTVRSICRGRKWPSKFMPLRTRIASAEFAAVDTFAAKNDRGVSRGRYYLSAQDLIPT